MSMEAWKDTGNCRECRRRSYCKSPCRANREASDREARQIVRSHMRASRIMPRMTDEEHMKNELRNTEMQIMGECPEERVDAVYNQCRDLAVHSTYSVFSIVAALCAECKSSRESIEAGVILMDTTLRIIRITGL